MGSLASMVSVGADEPATIGLNGAVAGIVHDSTGHNVTSQGITVKFAAVGGDVIGFADTNGDNVFTSGNMRSSASMTMAMACLRLLSKTRWTGPAVLPAAAIRSS